MDRLDRTRKQARRKALIKLLLLLFIALLVAGFLYFISHSVLSAVNRVRPDIQTVQPYCIEDAITAQAIVLRNEDTIYAPCEGEFENLVREGEKVKRGTELGYFLSSNGKESFKADQAGLFSCRTDGLEKLFSELVLSELGKESFAYKAKQQVGDENRYYKGQAVCKIVDNFSPIKLLLCFPADAIDLKLEDTRLVDINYQQKLLGKASIIESKYESGELFLMLEMDDFKQELLSERYIELEIVFGRYEGYIVPQKALVENDEEKGVYCVKGENIYFKPIKVVKLEQENVLIEGLDKNDMLVLNPEQANIK